MTLSCAAFRGRSAALERHRLVYAAVAPLMGGKVHALNITARTPEETDSTPSCEPNATVALQKPKLTLHSLPLGNTPEIL